MTLASKYRFVILVTTAPYNKQGSSTAYQFAQALLRNGQTIEAIFFYMDGVTNGNPLLAPPSDEVNVYTAWQELADKHQLKLLLCVTELLRRGLVDEKDLQSQMAADPIPGFIISGLGQLYEAVNKADRFIVF
jgi:tRNA 2-thiouridine synthesizing protein D